MKEKPRRFKVTCKESSLPKEEKKRLLWKVFDLILGQKNLKNKKKE
jgi:hypothetical protein